MRTTDLYFVLWNTTLYYRVLRCIKEYYVVLHNTIWEYRTRKSENVRSENRSRFFTTLCTKELNCFVSLYSGVLQTFSLYYRRLLCTTEYDFVLQNIILYYRILFCTTENSFALQNIFWSTEPENQKISGLNI